MAWRSSGNTNAELVSKMKRYGILQTTAVEEAFLAVDRVHFVPPGFEGLAHADRPLQEGRLHLSAPHIYGSVLEALDLKPNSSQSFLNLGSGCGYLSSLVACIVGPQGRYVGVELHEETVEHSRQAVQRWKAHTDVPAKTAILEFLQGNALEIDTSQGEAKLGFDRIYVGAAIENPEHLRKIVNLLNEGGIFVGPVSDELLKITRLRGGDEIHNQMHPPPPRTIRGRAPLLPAGFSQEIISAVRFASLSVEPSIPTIIRSTLWNPESHHSFPNSFREATQTILLCSRAPVTQKRRIVVPEAECTNAASLLPKTLWMEILSYTHRNWFEQPPSEESILRRQLAEERLKAETATRAKQEAENRLHALERERDVYRLLALRWQARLNGSGGMNHRPGDEADVQELLEAAASSFADDPFLFRVDGLMSMLRQSVHGEDESLQDADTSDDDESMEEPDLEETTVSSAAEVDTLAISSDAAARQQSRTVSIAEGDL